MRYNCHAAMRRFLLNMILPLLAGCLSCLPVEMQAQGRVVLYGTVTDARTGSPLLGASVTVGGRGTTTDTCGRYTLSVPKDGPARLRFRCLGYKAQTLGEGLPTGSLGDSIGRDVALTPADNALSEAVVVARNEARQLRMSAMPVSVLSARQLQGTASSISDVLARSAGITVRSTGGVGSASRVSVRGLEGKRMGLFVDEVPMGQMSDYISLDDIPIDMIERIEVYKGIVPYKFGGSALGGAVNVVTKEYPPYYADVAYEAGSFHTHKFNTVLKRTDPKSGLQFGLGGGYTYSKNDYRMRLTNLDDRVVRRDHDTYSKVLAGGSVKATRWWFDEIKMELIYSNTRQDIQGIEWDIREAYNHSSSLLAGLSLKRDNFFLPGLDLDFDASYNLGRYGLNDQAMARYDWDGHKHPPVSSYGGEQGTFPSDGQNRAHDAASKLNMNYIIDKRHAVNLNLFGSYTRQLPKDELMDKALGFSANFPSWMASLTTGLSYDLTLFGGKLQSATTVKNFYFACRSKSLENFYISKPVETSAHKDYWGWSEALRYQFTDEFLVKASFSSEVRIPTSEELVGNGYSILPSATLLPERVKGLNVGGLYHRNNAFGFVEAELNVFCNRLEDMIRFTADMIPTMARYRNFGSVRTFGVEAEIKGDVLPFLYFYINGTWQDLRDVRKNVPGTGVDNPTYDKRMPNIPYLMGNAGIEAHRANLFGGKGQNTRLLMDLSYVHQYFYDFEMSEYQDRKIPASLTIDAGVEHSFHDNRWTLTLKARNLLDKEVYSELNRPLPGRSVALKIRYLLK